MIFSWNKDEETLVWARKHPEGEEEVVRKGGQELWSKEILIPYPRYPPMASPSTICRKARWREQGRRDVPWQSTGATPQQAGLPAQQETPCGTSGGTPK